MVFVICPTPMLLVLSLLVIYQPADYVELAAVPIFTNIFSENIAETLISVIQERTTLHDSLWPLCNLVPVLFLLVLFISET